MRRSLVCFLQICRRNGRGENYRRCRLLALVAFQYYIFTWIALYNFKLDSSFNNESIYRAIHVNMGWEVGESC